MSNCCVNNCKNNYRNNKNVKYYRFPIYKRSDTNARKRMVLRQRLEWIRILTNKSSVTIDNIYMKRVCSDHFASGHKADVGDVNDSDWIPWQNIDEKLDESGHVSAVENCYGENYEFLKRNEAMYTEDLEFDSTTIDRETAGIRDVGVSVNNHIENMRKIKDDIAIQNDIPTLENTIDVLLKTNEQLQRQLNYYKMDIDCFQNDDKKTLYFTGLPEFVLLETMVNKLSPYIDRKDNSTLSKGQMIILTLMKLRHGLQFTDLGYRFGVSTQTASRTFYMCINVMYFKMKGMVYRPPREEVASTMPDCFKKNFGDQVTHIIDCLELFIETPYYFDTRIQCWSEYKHHYTLKYLVSITPQGMFEFVSKGYGGRANDMLVTTSCNFLDILEPNDLVLADKGFNMHDVFKMRRVNLEIPAFVSDHKQLRPLDVEHTRKIANVRIHVERCIGLLRRKFAILHRIIPVTMLSKPMSESDNVPYMDKIMTVCCALCNLCPTIIPTK